MNTTTLSYIGKIVPLVVLVLGFTTIASSQTLRQAIVEPISAQQAAMKLRDKLLEVILHAEGDPENQQIHLVVGFSTGHFSKDPLAAEASRMIAWSIVQDMLIEGDKVSCYAWETQVWDHAEPFNNPLTINSDLKQEKGTVKELFPLTTQQGSRGGHDTEQAIVEISSRLNTHSDAVIVLLTNTAASISIPGKKVIGANHPDYLSVLEQWNRLPSVNKSGASLELPYTIIDSSGKSLLRTLDAVVLVPKRFQGASLITGTRTERLSRPAISNSEPSPIKVRGIVPFLTLLAILFVVAIIGYFLVKMLSGLQGGWILEINGQKFDPFKVRNGEQICELVGEGFESIGEKSIVLNSIPPIRAIKFIRWRDRVEIQNVGMQTTTINGVYSPDPILKRNENYKIELKGEYNQNSGLPPKEIIVSIVVNFNRV